MEIVEKEDAPYGEVCPVCGAEIVERCRCPVAHTRCNNGHRWHYYGRQIVMDSYVKEDTNNK